MTGLIFNCIQQKKSFIEKKNPYLYKCGTIVVVGQDSLPPSFLPSFSFAISAFIGLLGTQEEEGQSSVWG